MKKTFHLRPTFSRGGFTLIELLVVIAILGILVTLVVPSFSAAKKIAMVAKTQARISSLTAGVSQYYEDTGRRYYPGQRYPGMLKGSSPAGAWTGSQWCSKAVFAKKDGQWGDFSKDPSYVRYSADLVMQNTGMADPSTDATGMEIALSDGFSAPMPILYFVSRGDQPGNVAQFVEGDNDPYYVGNTRGGTFSSFITDNKFGGSAPYNDGSFLLIGAGFDRKYFTADDVVNFSKN